MMKHANPGWNFFVFVVVSLCMLVTFGNEIWSEDHGPCLVRLDHKSVAKIAIAVDGTVLDFPVKPTKVILGRKRSFGIEYVESDLVISPYTSGSASNLFVYLESRRFTFELTTRSTGGCSILRVRDSLDNQMKVDLYGR